MIIYNSLLSSAIIIMIISMHVYSSCIHMCESIVWVYDYVKLFYIPVPFGVGIVPQV